MKIPSRNTPPPTEAEVRKHFEGQIPPDAIILRVPHTTILTLADNTLLWDWRGGFAKLNSNINETKINKYGQFIYCAECATISEMGFIQKASRLTMGEARHT